MTKITKGEMLLSLTMLASGFFVSNIYRTLTSITAMPLQSEMSMSTMDMALYAGLFHLTFGVVQIGAGICVDRYGMRKTINYVWPLTIIGTALPLVTENLISLMGSQIIIGIGCTPAFLVCTIYIAKYWDKEQYGYVTALVMAGGSIGMIITGTPLAWIIDKYTWRGAYWILLGASMGSWGLMEISLGRAGKRKNKNRPEKVNGHAIMAQSIWRKKYTYAMISLGLVIYGGFMALRTLWIGPIMYTRYNWTNINIGNLITGITIISIISLPIAGQLSSGRRQRKNKLFGGAIGMGMSFAILGFGLGEMIDIIMMALISCLAGLVAMQYADAKEEYEEENLGKGFAVLAAALFLGIALIQWLTGMAAYIDDNKGEVNVAAICWIISGLIIIGAVVYRKYGGDIIHMKRNY